MIIQRRIVMVLGLAVALGGCASSLTTREVGSRLVARLERASAVFHEIMSAPDKGIPRDLLEHAHAVAVFPGVVKGAFFVGGRGRSGAK